MELGFLILTDHSEALNGKIYVMGGGWNMLRLPQFPQEWGFGIGVMKAGLRAVARLGPAATGLV